MQMLESMTTNSQIYFTDLEKDKNAKIGIAALVGKLSPKPQSHKSGWAFKLANQLTAAGYTDVQVITDIETDWSKFDIMLLEHGMEFKGSFNIFGGANDDLYNQVIRLFSKGVRMYSLHHDMPCVGTLIEKRLKTGSDLFKTLEVRIEDAKEICASIPRVDRIQKTKSLCFGDSHSFSQYTPGYMTDRHDGLTLFGTLRRGIRSYVPQDIEELRIYLGNIDIRHHLMRQANPSKALKDMMAMYEQQLIDLEIDKIEVVQALPIENESRPLPKTGYYKDAPFAGSWAERTELVKQFNQLVTDMCNRNGWKTWRHPDVYINSFGELTFDVMEKPKSVHIAREYYRWDLVKNEPNTKLTKVTQALF
jgi:hypothetical protein